MACRGHPRRRPLRVRPCRHRQLPAGHRPARLLRGRRAAPRARSWRPWRSKGALARQRGHLRVEVVRPRAVRRVPRSRRPGAHRHGTGRRQPGATVSSLAGLARPLPVPRGRRPDPWWRHHGGGSRTAIWSARLSRPDMGCRHRARERRSGWRVRCRQGHRCAKRPTSLPRLGACRREGPARLACPARGTGQPGTPRPVATHPAHRRACPGLPAAHRGPHGGGLRADGPRQRRGHSRARGGGGTRRPDARGASSRRGLGTRSRCALAS
jgi:hypothetical protein